ncbi:ABC transporter substrate-binding protein [Halolamina salifodinae]|uniref:NitT/TauT family transport system substrate-binding protein n=1 Tax=Halolamina salifodinae TaxID=1202767 RepID=A0A8T4GVK0_9EURY|nr:ABC transporter substrate-binding protein [Halolamina salifodinae]MBP1986142.1 NitT/TauT family transport system substrate-binding protein [Halolamina salifodinae]
MGIEEQQAAIDAEHGDPEGLPVMRARFEHNGSPRYMLYTMKRLGLDHEHGFHLDFELVSDELEGGVETVEAKLQDGDADLIDIDYISTARERAEGAPIVAFHPYGRTVGGLVAHEDSDIDSLADLRGKDVGVVRRLDKNWILVRAACREAHGFDPDEAATPVEAGSKVELTRLLHDGEVDAVLQFWPIIPEITERGPYEEVLPMSRLVQTLSGTENKLPISTFLTSEEYLAEHGDAARAFADAYRATVDRLVEDDEPWEVVGERLMSYDDPAIVRAVRDGWREMVVRDWDAETLDGMDQLFGSLHAIGGTDALGVDHIPDGMFRLLDE